jgi:quercetin dioxygenase-like cupin family protein
MKVSIGIIPFVASAAVAMAAAAKPDLALKVFRKDSTPRENGVASRFTGDVFITSRFSGTGEARVSGSLVHFAAGARTAWHTHPHGQTLVVTNGCGWVQQEGGERELIRAGDIVWTPPGVKHWHGAASDTAMSHAAVIERVDTQEVVWMDKVSAQEFGEGACKS